jgi:MFS family permease
MPNKSLKLLYLTNGIFVLAASLLGPLYAVYVQKLGNDVLTVSSSWGIFLLSATLFVLLLSKFGDKIRKDYLFLSAFLLRTFVFLAFIFVSNIPELFILQIVNGLGEAMGTPSFNAIFAEHLDRGHHVKDYSNWQIINNILTALATMLGGVIVYEYGFSHLFIVMAVLSLVSCIIVYKTLKKGTFE